MNPLLFLQAKLPEFSRERLEALRRETLGKSVGGGFKGEVESKLTGEVIQLIDEELSSRRGTYTSPPKETNGSQST